MSLEGKLQLRPGQSVCVLDAPRGVALDLGARPAAIDPAAADAVLAFVTMRADLEGTALAAVEAAWRDALAWIAYPKGGRLGTDLNRDTLNTAANGHGVQAVRQVSIDETWSALRFRPA